MSASKDNLYARLRAVTGPLHDELERAVAIDNCIATRDAYRDYLLRLLRVHTAIERSLQAFDFSPYGFTYPWPYRSKLLVEDLASLGVKRNDSILSSEPLAPAFKGISGALGCLYVVEGSAKGARAILPQIKASLGFDGNTGASFFAGFGRDTIHLWHALISAINGIAPASEEGDHSVEAAVETFRLFKEELAPEIPSTRGRAPSAASLRIGP